MTLETLFPYQVIGARFLARMPSALLADDMGLGKSAQVIHAADLCNLHRILVVCPGSVRANWAREFYRFSPYDRPCAVLFSRSDPIPAQGVVVCSYDLLTTPSSTKARNRAEDNPSDEQAHASLKKARKLERSAKAFRAQLMGQSWDLLVIDEAHYLKERTTDRTRAVYGHGTISEGLVHRTKIVWRLTGTPAPNDASELWTHLKSAGLTKDPYWDFVFHFCEGFNGAYDYKITGNKNTSELKALLAKFMLRRKKEDVMKELPEIRFQQVTVEAGPVDLDPHFYEIMKRNDWLPADFYKAMGDEEAYLGRGLKVTTDNERNPLEKRLQLLHSLTNSLGSMRRYVGMQKIDACVAIFKEELLANPDMKIVVFAVHQSVIEDMRLKLGKFHPVTLYGKTPAQKRQHNIDKFVNDPKCRVFIGNVQAAGVGIDGLQKVANEVAFVEQSWVPSDNAQAAMRVHRIGQNHMVRVRIFSLPNSVDEQVQRTLMLKARELAKIF